MDYNILFNLILILIVFMVFFLQVKIIRSIDRNYYEMQKNMSFLLGRINVEKSMESLKSYSDKLME